MLSATQRGFAISGSFLQKQASYILFCHWLTLHELLKFCQVFSVEERDATTFSAITSSTPCFLVIPLQTLRNVIMNNKPYIRFVYTHSKRDSRNNYIDAFHDEIVLRA